MVYKLGNTGQHDDNNVVSKDCLSKVCENGSIFINRQISLPMANEESDVSQIVIEKDMEMDILNSGVNNDGFIESDCGSAIYSPDSASSNEGNVDKNNLILSDNQDVSTSQIYEQVDEIALRIPPGRSNSRTISIESIDDTSTKRKNLRHWDVFRTLSKNKDITIDEAYVTLFRKIVKVITSIFLTLLVLISALLSKGSLFLVTSNIYTNVTLYCRQPTEDTFTSCTRVPPDNHENVVYRLSQNIQIRWIWALFIIIITPYALTFVRCLWRACFKTTRQPTFKVLMAVMAIETLHSVGICILAFIYLPSADPIRGIVVMCGVAFIPSILRTFDGKKKALSIYFVDILAFLCQLSILILWPILHIMKKENTNEIWTIPVSLLLISIASWENFISRNSVIGKFVPKLRELRRNIRRMRTKIYIVVSVWKIILTLGLMAIIISNGVYYCLKTLYFNGNDDADKCPYLTDPIGVVNVESNSYMSDPFWVVFIQILSSLLCYYFAKSACKILLQIASFCLPLVLAAPIGLGFLVETCEAWRSNTTHPLMPSYLYWTCDINGIGHEYVTSLIQDYYLPVAFVWWLSFLWVTFHVWFPGVERLAQTEKLFIKPLYCGLLLEQSILLNRRRDDTDKEYKNSGKTNYGIEINSLETPNDPTYTSLMASQSKKKDTTPMIYACATMWHETEKEMVQVLTSLFRLDVDQCARRNAQTYFDVIDPDYYELEANIFFDDAFDGHDCDGKERSVNSFVKQLIRVVNIAARKVHKVCLKDLIAEKFTTPYGGKLEWTMPGGNKLIVHLKDREKIRHKKRWSQVMYMYYLLGHRLVALPIDAKRKQTIADNTFILTLDGDVDFQPAAVQLLLDRMNKNEKVAAACGRIHPVGTGPMIWYQKFEYAISHWLQKATEHMIGCVLCSPGCFSLFRASSLMDDNVINRYTTLSNKAKHFVQYDQGEDRWLCTLLLQQGYRVEYCAAADALTYSPEGFNEFYNQRRRWAPSTMANIMDLLDNWRQVININENISGLYILYQLLLFVSSLVTPGTIFLLIVGAISTAFPEITLLASLIANLVPVGGFIVLCLKARPRLQLTVAGVMSVIYAVVMMVVLVGLCLQTSREGICSPTTIFLLFVVGAFVLSGLLHPQEIMCLLHGALYFLAIPSMSMLLMIYSVCNVHLVSWGTRESEQESDNSNTKTAFSVGRGELGKIVSSLLSDNNGEDSSYTCSFGNLFKCICCPKSTTNADEKIFGTLLSKLEEIEKKIGGTRDTRTSDSKGGRHLKEGENEPKEVNTISNTQITAKDKQVCDDLLSMHKDSSNGTTPNWIHDAFLGNGEIRYLRSEETDFWKELIEQYLYPLDSDDERQTKLQTDLKELRNRASLFFFMINALFVVVIFSLQYVNQSTGGHGLSIPLPCHARNGRDLTLEPISLLFMIIFGLALFIQFLSMFFHRLSTFTHILSSTDVNCMKPNRAELNMFDISSKVQLAKDLGSFKQEPDDDSKSTISATTVDTLAEVSSITTDDSPKVVRRKMVYKLSKKRKPKMEQSGSISTRFEKAFLALAQDLKAQRKLTGETDHFENNLRKRSNSSKKRKGFNKNSTRAIDDIEQNKAEAIFRKAETLQSKWQMAASKVLEERSHKNDSWSKLVRGLVSQSKTNLSTITEGSMKHRIFRLESIKDHSLTSIQDQKSKHRNEIGDRVSVEVNCNDRSMNLPENTQANNNRLETSDLVESDTEDSNSDCSVHVYDTVYQEMNVAVNERKSEDGVSQTSANKETGEEKSPYCALNVQHYDETES